MIKNMASSCEEIGKKDEQSFSLSDIGVNLEDSKLTEQQKDTVTETFRNCKNIFQDLAKHEIKLTDEKLFKGPLRHISTAMIEEVRVHIAERLAADAIYPSQSPFSSNAVLVHKKHWSL